MLSRLHYLDKDWEIELRHFLSNKMQREIYRWPFCTRPSIQLLLVWHTVMLFGSVLLPTRARERGEWEDSLIPYYSTGEYFVARASSCWCISQLTIVFSERAGNETAWVGFKGWQFLTQPFNKTWIQHKINGFCLILNRCRSKTGSTV